MAVPTQLQNQIADDLALLAIDRISSYARRRSVAFNRKVSTTADPKEREEFKRMAEEFDRLSKTFGSLTDPDVIP